MFIADIRKVGRYLAQSDARRRRREATGTRRKFSAWPTTAHRSATSSAVDPVLARGNRGRRSVPHRAAHRRHALPGARPLDRLSAALRQSGGNDPRPLQCAVSRQRARRPKLCSRRATNSCARSGCRARRSATCEISHRRSSTGELPLDRGRAMADDDLIDASRPGKRHRPLDGADVPHVPARPARRAAGARPRHSERDQKAYRKRKRPDAQRREEDRRQVEPAQLRRVLVSLALARERRRAARRRHKPVATRALLLVDADSATVVVCCTPSATTSIVGLDIRRPRPTVDQYAVIPAARSLPLERKLPLLILGAARGSCSRRRSASRITRFGARPSCPRATGSSELGRKHRVAHSSSRIERPAHVDASRRRTTPAVVDALRRRIAPLRERVRQRSSPLMWRRADSATPPRLVTPDGRRGRRRHARDAGRRRVRDELEIQATARERPALGTVTARHERRARHTGSAVAGPARRRPTARLLVQERRINGESARACSRVPRI